MPLSCIAIAVSGLLHNHCCFDMQTIVKLLKLKPTLIRGNASEIMAVAGAAGAVTHGVDSTASPTDALRCGKQLAKEYSCIVGISGQEDLVRLCEPPPLLWHF